MIYMQDVPEDAVTAFCEGFEEALEAVGYEFEDVEVGPSNKPAHLSVYYRNIKAATDVEDRESEPDDFYFGSVAAS